ncbi:MAG: phosphoesterase [Verrucomicrobiales bacterium]
MNENVLVVPSAGVKTFLTGKFTPGANLACLEYIAQNLSFRPRAEVEEDPSFKQIIPYTLIKSGNSFWLSRRSKKQSEARLHGKYSLGIGGHINDQDLPSGGHDILMVALERELAEEVDIDAPRRNLNLLGIISDDSNPVGQVHMGLAYILELESPGVKVRETDMMEGQWVKAEALREFHAGMETWSQIVCENLDTTASPKAIVH